MGVDGSASASDGDLRAYLPYVEASTDFVPVAQRTKYWESYNASELVGLRCSAYSSCGLRARERNFDLGALRLADIDGNEHVVERTASMLRRHPKDSIFACLLLQGEAFFYQSGSCIRVNEGDLIVYGTTMPYLYGFTRDMRQLLVDIDPARLGPEGGALRPAAPIKIGGGLRSGGRLTGALRQTLCDFVSQPLASDAERVGHRVQLLLQAVLEPSAPGERPTQSSSAVRLVRAEAFIDENLASPGLSAALVARHVCVSVRQLDRIFARHGCTATQWIWQQRLERARCSLSDPGRLGLTVGEIALQCGFATQAHFGGAFRARYGTTPMEHRVGSALRR